MYQISLDKFEGPLDLLLQIIERQELDISQVSLATVTDQYLSYIEQAPIGPMELADFLVVATKLLMIKSRSLLPPVAEEDDDSGQLEAQLKLYKEYIEATHSVEQLLKRHQISVSRERLPQAAVPGFYPPESVSAEHLATLFRDIITRVEYVVNLPQRVMERAVTLKETLAQIRSRLRTAEQLSFQDVVQQAQSTSEIVVCFMALLELIKSGEIAVEQEEIFDDIVINRLA